jgi:hypothetical protein
MPPVQPSPAGHAQPFQQPVSSPAVPAPRHVDAARPAPAAAQPVSTEGLPENVAAMLMQLSSAAAAIGEKRKRETVEKAVQVLAGRLAAGNVAPAVIAKLEVFASKLGTSESRAVWKTLNDEYFEEVKPFLSIKFL